MALRRDRRAAATNAREDVRRGLASLIKPLIEIDERTSRNGKRSQNGDTPGPEPPRADNRGRTELTFSYVAGPPSTSCRKPPWRQTPARAPQTVGTW